MAGMITAIETVLVSQCKTALAAYYPATPTGIDSEYVNTRFEDGNPTSMAGQWYCSIHGVKSRDATGMPGLDYVKEEWSAMVTITVRSAYAPDSRITDPMTLYDTLTRLVTNRLRNDPWGIMAAINTAFNSVTTNGLTLPFSVRDPMPAKQRRNPAWLQAITKKKTSQISSFSGTISLTGALQIQPLGNIA